MLWSANGVGVVRSVGETTSVENSIVAWAQITEAGGVVVFVKVAERLIRPDGIATARLPGRVELAMQTAAVDWSLRCPSHYT